MIRAVIEQAEPNVALPTLLNHQIHHRGLQGDSPKLEVRNDSRRSSQENRDNNCMPDVFVIASVQNNGDCHACEADDG